MPRRTSPLQHDGPLTLDELARLENIPAAKPVPAHIAERLATHSIYLSSADVAFDPRRSLEQISGSYALWRLAARDVQLAGPRVAQAELLKPGSLSRAKRSRGAVAAYRPEWQPYTYHPKAAGPPVEKPRLYRKSGTKVRPHIVFNNDDRMIFIPEGYPWHCIGRVFIRFGDSGDGWKTTGTGALVGSRTVLTSSHLIPWGRVKDSQIKFVAAYFGGLSVKGPGAASWITRVTGYNAPGRAGWDVAVLRLEDPLGDWLGYFGTRSYDDDWEDKPRWMLVGYPGEVAVSAGPAGYSSTNTGGEVPTRQYGISIEDDDSDAGALELEHYGDTTDGNSGGPLWDHWPDGPYIIGVHSGDEIVQFLGQTVSSNNIAAGGASMNDLVRWARQNFV